jgi:nucleotide-binding universal stress UspA family protein
MLDFTRILVPIDLEEPSLAPVHEAAFLARRFHSELLLLHVISRLSYLGLHSHGHGEQLSEEIKQAEVKLDSSILPELAGLNARRIVVRGNPSDVIPTIAQEEKQGLIVMGDTAMAASRER